MNRVIILLAVLGCTTALPVNDSALWDLDWSKIRSEDIYVDPITDLPYYGPGGRVIGGNEVTRNTVPYQVAVINDRNGFCGGSLISTTWVLTAAHCTISSTAATIVLGAHNVQTTTEATQVRIASSRIINHANYNGNTLINDIALVQLRSAAPLSNNVRIIALAPATAANYAGQTALLTGWGRTTDANNNISPVLRGINLPIITNAVCAANFGIITASNICTSGAGNVGACNGDSGGPLVVNNVQVGVVSFGATRCAGGSPTGYARVSSFRTWIQTNSGV